MCNHPLSLFALSAACAKKEWKARYSLIGAFYDLLHMYLRFPAYLLLIQGQYFPVLHDNLTIDDGIRHIMPVGSLHNRVDQVLGVRWGWSMFKRMTSAFFPSSTVPRISPFPMALAPPQEAILRRVGHVMTTGLKEGSPQYAIMP